MHVLQTPFEFNANTWCIYNRIELTHAMLCSQQWLVLASFPGGGFGLGARLSGYKSVSE